MGVVLEKGWEQLVIGSAETIADEIGRIHRADRFIGEEIDGKVGQPDDAHQQVHQQRRDHQRYLPVHLSRQQQARICQG